MTPGKPKSNGGPASRADDSQPDLKWVVEWLVEREGQRRTAALLGVNRKTVALALRRERLTGRMTLAVQRLMANLDDPGWERTTPLDRSCRCPIAQSKAHGMRAGTGMWLGFPFQAPLTERNRRSY